jgi:hypothetical protein
MRAMIASLRCQLFMAVAVACGGADAPPSEPLDPDGAPSSPAPVDALTVETDAPTGELLRFDTAIRPILAASCGPTCHLQNADGAGGLTLGTNAQLAYENLVEQPMLITECDTMLRVDINSADPARSGFYLKLAGSTCGPRMPFNGMLTPDELALIERWIAGGARE